MTSENKNIKNIQISNDYQPNIQSISDEDKITKKIIKSIYERFMNETNSNHMHNSFESLSNYRYVPNKYILPAGRYVRYIDTSNHQDMPLKLGGFVLNDNKYSIVFKSAGGCGRIVRLNKRHCVLFIYITDAEHIRSNLQN
uniref:Uncharacterized protein n=1 Tax=viral metagenome TaxID=1070528 RepID=A0A6C0F5S2_9ZZZZ|tara:strand:+ start:651 stop:1073 length:423 start_codon:yes stop_codon:yes gene_type:complete